MTTDPIPTGTVCTISEPNPPPGYSVEIDPPQVTMVEGSTPVSVTITYTRILGSLVITKVIEGDPTGATRTFAISVDCEPGTTYDSVQEITVPPGATTDSVTIPNIPVGVICSVTDPEVEVVAVNTREVAGLAIRKILQGPVDGASTTFSVRLELRRDRLRPDHHHPRASDHQRITS